MVQQTNDCNFNKHGLQNTGTSLPNHDKQVSQSVTTKKNALKDLQNENRITVPKCVGSSLFSNENGPQYEVEVSGMKRPALEYLVASPPHNHSITSNAAQQGHLVYVRRRPEVEVGKNGILNNTSNGACYPQERGEKNETAEQRSQVTKSNICIPGVAHIHGGDSLTSGKPSVPSSFGKFSNIILQPSDSDYHPVSSALDHPKKMNEKHWEERYCHLQDLLKLLDQSDQEDYVQMLHSLSSVELSKHAVELEKRSIQLSLDEAKELQQVQLLDVLGKHPKNSRVPSAQQGHTEK